MATNLVDSKYLNYDGKQKISVNDLFVRIVKTRTNDNTEIDVGGNKRWCLQDLFVSKNGKTSHRVKSYEEFQTALAKNQLYTSAELFERIVSTNQVEYKNIDVPAVFNSTVIVDVGGKKVDVPYGNRRALAVQSVSTKDKNNYLLVKVAGNNEMQFVKKSDIYFNDDTSQKNLSDFKGEYKDLEDTTLYTKDGNAIVSVFTQQEFVFDSVIAQDSLDLATMTKRTYSLNQDSTGVTVTFSNNPINTSYAELTPTTVEVQDERNSSRTKKEPKYKVKNYVYSASGNFVRIQLKDEKEESWTNCKDILDPVTEKPIKKEDLKNFEGKAVKTKVGDNIVETEPLTHEEISLFYETNKSFVEDPKVEPMSENSYIHLTNGKYAKEVDAVEPICYNVARADDAVDAYLATIIVGTETKSIIIPKTLYDKTTKDTITLSDGQKFSKSELIALKRSPRMASSDIVQTTNNDKDYQSAQLLRKIGANKRASGSLNVTKAQEVKKNFSEAYLAGEYKVDKVYDEQSKTFVDIDSRHGRYSYSDEWMMDDHSADLKEYAALKKNPVKYEFRNGKIIQTSSGPKYDIAQGIRNSFKAYFQVVKVATAFYISGFGILAAIAAPVAAAAFAGGMLAAIPAIPLVNLIYGAIKNRKNAKWKDVLKHQVKVEKKLSVNDLNNLFEKVNNAKNKYVQISEYGFLDKYNELRRHLLGINNCQIKSKFKMVDGVGEVTIHNAREAKLFQKQFRKDEKQLKKLEKQKAKASKKFEKLKNKYEKTEISTIKLENKFKKVEKDYKTKLSNLNDKKKEVEKKIETFNSKSLTSSRNKEVEKLLENAEKMKNLLLIKKYNNNNKYELTNEELEVIKNLDYDFEKDVYLYKNKIYDLKTGLPMKVSKKTVTSKDDDVLKIRDLIKNIQVKLTSKDVIERNFNSVSDESVVNYSDGDVIKPIKVEEQPTLTKDEQEKPLEIEQPKPVKKVTKKVTKKGFYLDTEKIEPIIKIFEAFVKYRHNHGDKLTADDLNAQEVKRAMFIIDTSDGILEKFVVKFKNSDNEIYKRLNNIKKELLEGYQEVTDIKSSIVK